MGSSKSRDTNQNVHTLEALRTMPPQPRRSKTGLIIIAVVAVAAIVVCATLFFWWSRGPTVYGWCPTVNVVKSPVENGWKIYIVSITVLETSWNDMGVQLSDGTEAVEWHIHGADLDGGFNTTAPCATKSLGTLSVTLTVIDNSGNGVIGGSDYLTLTANPAFSSAATYTVKLIHLPSAEPMCADITFTGA